MKKFGLFLLVILSSNLALAKHNDIVGTWSLVKMEKQEADGKWSPRCFSPNGLITYTKQGYMAVGINCMESEGSLRPTTEMKDTIFYTGTYKLDGNTITHHVINSSDPIFFGKDLTRTVEFDDKDIITLQGSGKASPVRLIWKRNK